MCLFSNQANARLLASYSTGNVIKVKSVVTPKSTIPTKNNIDPKALPEYIKIKPAMITKFDTLLDTPTAGTICERNLNQL